MKHLRHLILLLLVLLATYITIVFCAKSNARGDKAPSSISLSHS
jgi:uncharacterized protein (UPF0333 family)